MLAQKMWVAVFPISSRKRIQNKNEENQVTIHLFIILLFINPLNLYAPGGRIMQRKYDKTINIFDNFGSFFLIFSCF